MLCYIYCKCTIVVIRMLLIIEHYMPPKSALLLVDYKLVLFSNRDLRHKTPSSLADAIFMKISA